MQEVTTSAKPPIESKSKSERRVFVGLLIFACLLVAALTVAPFFLSGTRLRMFITHDMPTHVELMDNFNKVLRSGVWYPRWMADVNYGYGVGTFVFYPPLVFYMSSFIHLFARDWTATLFALCTLTLAASGLSMYRLSRLFHNKLASLTAALIYMLFPYHTLDLYERGAVPEYVGLAFIPLTLFFFIKLGREGQLKYYAGLGLVYGLQVMTHLPVSYIFTYALALYAVLWMIKEKDIKIGLRLAAGMFLGLTLSAIYWLPAALETKHAYEFVTDIFPYHKSYIFGGTPVHYFDLLVYHIFYIQTATLLLVSGLLFFIQWFSKKAASEPAPLRTTSHVWLWMALAVVTTYMNTVYSMPVAKLIPNIQIAVPAWRWMAIASAFTSLLVGAAVHRVSNRAPLSTALMWSARALLLIAVAANMWFTVKRVMLPKMGTLEYVRKADFVDHGFIPKGARGAEELPQTERVVVMPNGTGEITAWDPQYRALDTALEEAGTVRLKTYNFPGWEAKIDGQEAPVLSDTGGAIVVRVPPGKHKVELSFVNTTPRNIGAALFFISLLTILGLSLAGKINLRRRTSPAAESA